MQGTVFVRIARSWAGYDNYYVRVTWFGRVGLIVGSIAETTLFKPFTLHRDGELRRLRLLSDRAICGAAAMQTIGLIGGMSWESTALYYKLINDASAIAWASCIRRRC